MSISIARERSAARQPSRARGKSALGAAIAAEAKSWIDTPFVWGQSQKGVGCDCKGLVAGVFREISRPEGESFYANFASYRADRPVPSPLILEGFGKLFDQVALVAGPSSPTVARIEAGDVLLMKYGNPAVIIGHMGIAIGEGRAVHAYHGMNAKVRSRDLDVLFHKFPLHSVWRARP